MKSETLFACIGGLDEDLLERSENPTAGAVPKFRAVRILSAAACFALLLSGVILLARRFPGEPTDSSTIGSGTAETYLDTASETEENHLVSIDIPDFSYGMGFEGLMYPDIAEEDNGNPWREETTPDTLPVYRNTGANPFGMALGLDEETLLAMIRRAADAVGMKILDYSYSRVGNGLPPDAGLDPEQVLTVTAKTDSGRISADGDGTVTVWFDDRPLPLEYSFTHTETSDEEAGAVLAYLTEQYRDLLGFGEPVPVLSGDCRVDGVYSRRYSVYDGAGGAVSDMLNYAFCHADFAPDDEGKLMLIRLYNHTVTAEAIGDYPIISPDAAAKLLFDGHYITSVPMEFTGGEYPKYRDTAKTELVYRCGRTEGTWLPYYRFYVVLSGLNAAEGLMNYGAFYVPAVDGRYITEMPVYDGSFN